MDPLGAVKDVAQEKVNCPICNNLFSVAQLDYHIDECLNHQALQEYGIQQKPPSPKQHPLLLSKEVAMPKKVQEQKKKHPSQSVRFGYSSSSSPSSPSPSSPQANANVKHFNELPKVKKLSFSSSSSDSDMSDSSDEEVQLYPIFDTVCEQKPSSIRHPHCPNRSNPFHECTAYCVERFKAPQEADPMDIANIIHIDNNNSNNPQKQSGEEMECAQNENDARAKEIEQSILESEKQKNELFSSIQALKSQVRSMSDGDVDDDEDREINELREELSKPVSDNNNKSQQWVYGKGGISKYAPVPPIAVNPNPNPNPNPNQPPNPPISNAYSFYSPYNPPSYNPSNYYNPQPPKPAVNSGYGGYGAYGGYGGYAYYQNAYPPINQIPNKMPSILPPQGDDEEGKEQQDQKNVLMGWESEKIQYNEDDEYEVQYDDDNPFHTECPYSVNCDSVEASQFPNHVVSKHMDANNHCFVCPVCILADESTREEFTQAVVQKKMNLVHHIFEFHSEMLTFDSEPHHDAEEVNSEPPPIPIPSKIGDGYVEQTLTTRMDTECQICFETFEVGSKVAWMECFCVFHIHCISSWSQKKTLGKTGLCPVHAE